MDILYRSIVKRLQNEIDQSLWIDLEAGQLDEIDENYPVTFPAVFIDFSNCQWQNLSDGRQSGDLEINIRVAIDTHHDFHGSSPSIVAAADSLKLINDIHAALHTFGGGIIPIGNSTEFQDMHFSPLMRSSSSAERRSDGLKVYNMTYLCEIYDNHAVPDYLGASPDPVITTRPVPAHDPITISYWGGAFSNTKTRIVVEMEYMPEGIQFRKDYTIRLIPATGEEYTTYPGEHIITAESQPAYNEFIIDVPFDPNEPYTDFYILLVRYPY